MRKIASGWVLIFVVYLITYFISAWMYLLLFNRNIDSDWNHSGLFIGACLTMIPYVAAGIFIRKWLDATTKQAFWISIVPIIAEKIVIYLIGVLIVSDPSVTDHIWLAIRGEFAPYFTPLYLVAGLLSLAVCILIGKGKKSPFQLL